MDWAQLDLNSGSVPDRPPLPDQLDEQLQQQLLLIRTAAQLGLLPLDQPLSERFPAPLNSELSDTFAQPNSLQSWDQSAGWTVEQQLGLEGVPGQWDGVYGGADELCGLDLIPQPRPASDLPTISFEQQLALILQTQPLPTATSFVPGPAPPETASISPPSSISTGSSSTSPSSNGSPPPPSTSIDLSNSITVSHELSLPLIPAEQSSQLSREPAQVAQKKKRAQHPQRLPPASDGQIFTEKSCVRCRARKVKCDRRYPICANCQDRKEECDLISLHPDDKPLPNKRDREDARRILSLERELAELKEKLTQVSIGSGTNAVQGEWPVGNLGAPSAGPIGHSSLDWRLATPAMEASLSQHLCDSFFSSCCFLMPSFNYFRSHLPAYADPNGPSLSEAAKAAISAFWVIGARASPHSALLGAPTTSEREGNEGKDSLDAGARRQTACLALFRRAHRTAFEHRVADEASAESLAATLALFQMTSFVELNPVKSRGLIRTAIAHFKELQDVAWSRGAPEEARELRKTFALAVYSADSVTAAYSRRACLLAKADLETYFSDVFIVMPSLPADDLNAMVERLEADPNQREQSRLAMINHLAYCWTCSAQRLFAQLAAPHPIKSAQQIELGVRELWSAVDRTRAAIHRAQKRMQVYAELHPHSHSHEPTKGGESALHAHESDFYLHSIRVDRDLIDLNAMSLSLLHALPPPGLPHLRQEAEGRVRRDLKLNALFFRIYTHGPDRHMGFHHVFQMEHNPHWTTMARQRVGEEGGPRCADEELTGEELNWLAEGLEGACFYTPIAERRLRELRPDRVRVLELSGGGSSLSAHG